VVARVKQLKILYGTRKNLVQGWALFCPALALHGGKKKRNVSDLRKQRVSSSCGQVSPTTLRRRGKEGLPFLDS